MAIKLTLRRNLDDLPQIHDRYGIANMMHDRKVVRDEQVRDTQALLKRFEQVDNLSPNRYIQG
jgi:hypothetical protein